MRLRRYSNTASVPLATIAALGVRNGFPSRLRHLKFNTHTHTHNSLILLFVDSLHEVDTSFTHLRLVHRPNSGGMFSRSLLDRSRVDRWTSFLRCAGSTPHTWLFPSNTVSRETTSYRTSGNDLNLLWERQETNQVYLLVQGGCSLAAAVV